MRGEGVRWTSGRGTRRESVSGREDVLRSIDDDVLAVRAGLRFEDGLAQNLTTLVTIGGAIDWADGYLALTVNERCLLDALLATAGSAQATITHAHACRPDEIPVTISYTSLGRLRLSAPSMGGGMPSEVQFDDDSIGATSLPRSDYERACARARLECDFERINLGRMRSWLVGEELEGNLQLRAEQAADHITHVESVAFYLGAELWDTLHGRRELERSTELRVLGEKPLVDWTDREVLLVASIVLLFSSGGVTRLEEFNSRQLSATSVLMLIESLRARYIGLGCTETTRTKDSLSTRAVDVGSMRDAATHRGFLLYRQINGITLTKHECIADDYSNPVPEDVYREWVRDSSAVWLRYLENSRVATLEGHLVDIVRDALRDGEADFAMTSGPRRLLPFAGLHPVAKAGAVEADKEDFFCCCVPSKDYVSKRPPLAVVQSMYRVSKRMQFNRWHFVPGNFAQVPSDRHFYYPPLLPDITRSSDRRHGGHIDSQVRNTIRIPGPLITRPPFVLGDNRYRGFFDLRLVRVDDHPFTERDLLRAIPHAVRVEAFWVAARRLMPEAGVLLFARSFYDSAMMDRGGGKHG